MPGATPVVRVQICVSDVGSWLLSEDWGADGIA